MSFEPAFAEAAKRRYPAGSRIVLDQMGDDPHSIPLKEIRNIFV